MRSIILKELHEHRLIFLAALLSLAVAISIDLDGWGIRPNLLQEDFFGAVLATSAIMASLLAVLQSAKELPRDRWAFLIHRGLSVCHIFWGKCVAALLIYSVVSFTPVLYMAAKLSIVGIEGAAFDWAQFRMSLLAIATGPSLYFAVLIVVWREASLFKSRLLPLGVPMMSFTAAFGIGYELNGANLPLWTFGLTFAATALLAAGAWGTFIRNGENTGRPAIATASLGGVMFSVILALMVFSFCMVFVALDELWRISPDMYMQSYSHRLNEEGEVLQFREGRRIDRQSRGPRNWEVTNLDTAETTKFEQIDLAEYETNHLPKLKLAEATHIVSPRNPLIRFFSGQRHHVLERVDGFPIENSQQQRSEMSWLFSATTKLFYGYRVTDDYQANRNQIELELVAGRDGFAKADSDTAPESFRKLLANNVRAWSQARATWQRDSDSRVISRPTDRPLRQSNVNHFLFEDGVYAIDFRQRTIRRFFAGREDQTIRSVLPYGPRSDAYPTFVAIASANDADKSSSSSESANTKAQQPQGRRAVCVVYDDRIDVHEPVAVFREERSTAKRKDHGQQHRDVSELGQDEIETHEVYSLLPGTLLKSIVMPEPVRNVPLFEVAELGGADQSDDTRLMGYTVRNLFGSFVRHRVIIAKQDGSIVSAHYVGTRPDGLSWVTMLCVASAALVVPLLAFPVVVLADSMLAGMAGGGLGIGELFWVMFTDHVGQSLLLCVPFLAVALLCARSASVTAKRFDFDSSERRRWMVWSFLLGPAGLLMLYSLRHLPPTLKCGSCGANGQLASRSTCDECGNEVTPIQLDGTEVFAA